MADAGIHDFAFLLNDLNEGKLRDEASKSLTDMLAFLRDYAVDTRGKAKGKLLLRLNVSVEQNGLVTLDGEVETKQPKPLRGQDNYYLTKRAGLSRSNPRQQELPGVREAPRAAEVREPGAKAQGEDK